MTIATESERKQYNGSGTTGPFPYPYKFFADTDLKVVLTDSDGADSTLVLTTDYTVSGAGEATGGSVTLVEALAVGEKLTIIPNLSYTQSADYEENDDFPAATHENALDRLCLQIQQVKLLFDRCIKIGETSDPDLDIEIPSPEASKYLAWNADADALINAESTGDAVVSSFAATLIDDESATEMLATLGLTVSAFAKTLLDDASAAAALTTLGLSAFAQTLIDDADAAAARTTLGAEKHIVGKPFLWFGETPPTGSNEFDGSALNRTTYATLFALWGEIFGAGDGSTTFGTPDVRGLFPRFWDHGAGIDPDAATRTDRGDGTGGDHVGTTQADQNKAHTHTKGVSTNYALQPGGDSYYIANGPAVQTGSSGGDEARPGNIAMMLCYWHS